MELIVKNPVVVHAVRPFTALAFLGAALVMLLISSTMSVSMLFASLAISCIGIASNRVKEHIPYYFGALAGVGFMLFILAAVEVTS